MLFERHDVVRWVNEMGDLVEIAFGGSGLTVTVRYRCLYSHSLELELGEDYLSGHQRLLVKVDARIRGGTRLVHERAVYRHLNDVEIEVANTVFESLLRVAKKLLEEGPCYAARS